VTLPPLVARAKAAAEALGFDKSCRDEDGMLLHVLAGRRGIERVAEIGTGTGVGTAWLASALPPGVPLVTAERDERLAGAAGFLQCARVDFPRGRELGIHLDGPEKRLDGIRPLAGFRVFVADREPQQRAVLA
jgi:predicted O-methyltransferase YrrM